MLDTVWRLFSAISSLLSVTAACVYQAQLASLDLHAIYSAGCQVPIYVILARGLLGKLEPNRGVPGTRTVIAAGF